MDPSAVGLVFGPHREDLRVHAVREAVERLLGARGLAVEARAGRGADEHAPLLVHGGAPPAGAHIWNGSALAGIDPAPLAEYLYVAVPTNADQAEITSVRRDVAVVPSWITGLSPRAPVARRDAIGVQADAEALGGDWVLAIRELRGFEKALLAVGGEGERGATTSILQSLGEGRRLAPASVDDLFAAIGGLRLLVCTSLEPAILAYLQGVPFLLRADAAGGGSYFADRGLETRLFTSGDDILAKARAALDHAPDWSELVERDREVLDRHADLLVEAVRSRARVAVPEPLARAKFPERLPPAGPVPERSGGRESASRRPEENLRVFLSRLEAELLRLHHEVASQCSRIAELASDIDSQSSRIAEQTSHAASQSSRIAELAAEVDRLQIEMLRREDLIDDMRASRVWRLASRIQIFAARLRATLRRAPA